MTYGNPRRLLTPAEVREIRAAHARWRQQVAIRKHLLQAAAELQQQINATGPTWLAEQHEVSIDTIHDVVARRSYKEIR